MDNKPVVISGMSNTEFAEQLKKYEDFLEITPSKYRCKSKWSSTELQCWSRRTHQYQHCAKDENGNWVIW